jgi:hypothetical protein
MSSQAKAPRNSWNNKMSSQEIKLLEIVGTIAGAAIGI